MKILREESLDMSRYQLKRGVLMGSTFPNQVKHLLARGYRTVPDNLDIQVGWCLTCYEQGCANPALFSVP